MKRFVKVTDVDGTPVLIAVDQIQSIVVETDGRYYVEFRGRRKTGRLILGKTTGSKLVEALADFTHSSETQS